MERSERTQRRIRGQQQVRANHARRRDLLDQVADGTLDFELLDDLAAIDPVIAQIRLRTALAAHPLWGKTAAKRFLDQLDVPAAASLKWMHNNTRADTKARIRTQIPLGPGNRPELPRHFPWFERITSIAEGAPA